MSRAQGDSYKTHTDHDLNAYRARLDAKLLELEEREEKWHRVGDGWVLTTKKNKLAQMRAELQTLIVKRNAARDAHDEPHFRWYAERAIKLEEQIREAEWEAH